MMAFHDARCPGCDDNVAWYGLHADRPKCGRCGHRPDQATLESYDRQAAERNDREDAAQKAAKEAAGDGPTRGDRLRKARRDADMTLDVGRRLGIGTAELSSAERDCSVLPPEKESALLDFYAAATKGEGGSGGLQK